MRNSYYKLKPLGKFIDIDLYFGDRLIKPEGTNVDVEVLFLKNSNVNFQLKLEMYYKLPHECNSQYIPELVYVKSNGFILEENLWELRLTKLDNLLEIGKVFNTLDDSKIDLEHPIIKYNFRKNEIKKFEIDCLSYARTANNNSCFLFEFLKNKQFSS